MHDVGGLDNYVDAQNHISNQYINIDNRNDVVDDALI